VLKGEVLIFYAANTQAFFVRDDLKFVKSAQEKPKNRA
jgi:hypothetical protein